MKKFLFIFLFLGVSTVVCQNKQVLYNWEVTPQTLLLNPGSLVTSQFHAGIPLASGFHINAGSSGVSVFDVFADDGIDINTKITNTISRLSSRDFFTINQQLDVLNFGWLSKGFEPMYFSGGIYQELDVIAYFPKDIAILAWEGNRNYIGKAFDFSHVSARADVLTVYHFGVNKQVSKKLTAGVRLKLYSSMISVSSTRNKGAFKTTEREGSNNIYEHTVTDLDMEVNTSGFISLDGLEQPQVSKKLLGRALLGGNLGIGIDAGITYEFDKQLSLTASVLDLGAIFHTKDTESYKAKGDYTLDGIELIFPELENDQSTIPYYDNLEDDIVREIPIDTLNTGYTQLRPTKINAGLHYDFGRFVGDNGGCNCKNKGAKQKRVSQAGVQYFSIFRPGGLQLAGTLYYNRRLGNALSIKTTYTIDRYSAKNIGAGMFLNIQGVNLFLAADNLVQMSNLAKANSVSLQVGINYILN